MNIFILDLEIEPCARYHCDQHVVKMILEQVQILCTALHHHGFTPPYRPTHDKHPCVRWAAESYDNMRWLRALTEALNREYRYRYRKERDHASMKVLQEVSRFRIESQGLTPFAQAMPETYRQPGDPVAAYRAFYRHEKAAFARWTRRAAPAWMQTSLTSAIRKSVV
ncbi:pyrimidine dimer DNA glycosylase/endonuclease V [Motiliproteus sp. SC1-56]|uniref:pyrimidine dimer DNA glycosylase/endonuclease V n=1 Tax=Motiliproteus sp. SC1-56 TaxID=2799565 RepID=UPI001A9032E1|nr:pyrimidine dimer DNA glycosylase/endonuclease V [Motiliproteus sp. SC1-56]